MKIFTYDSPLFRFFDRLGCLLLLNLVFIITSLPVVTVGVSLTALYDCLMKLAADDRVGVVKRYFRSFKSNFKKSMLLSLCVLPFFVLATCDALLFIFGEFPVSTLGMVAMFLPSVLVFSMLAYVFPLQAQFENTVIKTLRNSLLFALGNFAVTLLMTAVNLVVPLMALMLPELFYRVLPLCLLYGFSLPGMINARLLKKIFDRYVPAEALSAGQA